MLRPGIPELLAHLRLVGATIVVYTHSEDRWAVKVCQAMERLAGWPFIHRVFSRMGLVPPLPCTLRSMRLANVDCD